MIGARLLYDADARKDARATIRKKVRKTAQPSPWMEEFVTTSSMTRHAGKTSREESVVEYGPYLPTLVRKLEAGDFA